MTQEAQLGIIVQNYLPLEVELYSLHKPPGQEIASIFSTRRDGSTTDAELIRQDHIYKLCAEYLETAGAPCFEVAIVHREYVSELQRQLRKGLSPAAAQAQARSAVGQP